MFHPRLRFRANKKECAATPSVAQTPGRPASIGSTQEWEPTPSATSPSLSSTAQKNRRLRFKSPIKNSARAVAKIRAALGCLSKLNCFRGHPGSADSTDGETKEVHGIAYGDLEISDVPIGSGACGKVFPVALKKHCAPEMPNNQSPPQNTTCDLVVKQVDAWATDFLKQEFSALSSVRHPNIVQALAMMPHPHQDQQLMVMERLRGPDLEEHVAVHGVLSEAQSLEVMRSLLSALVVLHQRGIGHLDIKPGNIMLRSQLADPGAHHGPNKTVESVLVDFGLSVTCPHPEMISKNLYRVPRGTPVYAAPEIGAGKQYAIEKADIWSCGITLYELVTGMVPYDPPGSRCSFEDVSDLIRKTGHISELYSQTDGSSSSRAPPPSPRLRTLLESFLFLSPGDRPTAQQALGLVCQLQRAATQFQRGIT